MVQIVTEQASFKIFCYLDFWMNTQIRISYSTVGPEGRHLIVNPSCPTYHQTTADPYEACITCSKIWNVVSYSTSNCDRCYIIELRSRKNVQNA